MLRDLEGYAASARLMTSPLQLGDWLEKTFGEEILAKRRARERAAAALEKGAPVVVQAIAAPRLRAAAGSASTSEPPSTGMLPASPSPVPPPIVAMPARRDPKRGAGGDRGAGAWSPSPPRPSRWRFARR